MNSNLVQAINQKIFCMKKILLLLFLMTFSLAFSQMTINETFTTQELIQDQFIGNPNFPASNFVTRTGTVFNSVNGIGYFYANGVDFPFDEGLLLSTGNIAEVPGANTTIVSGGANNWSGDIDLELTTGTQNTYNASYISFDFVADVANISLDFILTSEEYGQFECTFGDIFAFILTDIDAGTKQNIALVPDTFDTISITNVRGGANDQCAAANENYFDRYNYTVSDTNISSIPADDSPINLNGQTGVFVIVDDLIIGRTYNLKIVVADYLDTVYDTALFIRNDSFGAFPMIVDEPENIVINDDDNDGSETFNLRMFEDAMIGNTINTSVYSFDFTYHLSQADADAGKNEIPNPSTYENTAALQEIYVRMRNSYTGTAVTTSFKITVDAELLSTPEFEADEVVMYPNPVVDELTIDATKIAVDTIEIYNISGQLIQTETKNNNGMITVDFSNLGNGVYFAQINTDKGKIYKRIIK